MAPSRILQRPAAGLLFFFPTYWRFYGSPLPSLSANSSSRADLPLFSNEFVGSWQRPLFSCKLFAVPSFPPRAARTPRRIVLPHFLPIDFLLFNSKAFAALFFFPPPRRSPSSAVPKGELPLYFPFLRTRACWFVGWCPVSTSALPDEHDASVFPWRGETFYPWRREAVSLLCA